MWHYEGGENLGSIIHDSFLPGLAARIDVLELRSKGPRTWLSVDKAPVVKEVREPSNYRPHAFHAPGFQPIDFFLRLTMMPQELIDAIVGEVDSVKDVEACSLASSSLRGAGQRSLLRSLRLELCEGSARLWDTRLAQSLYLARYVTTLNIASNHRLLPRRGRQPPDGLGEI
ncbi:hypothetical protein C8R44DRAFT_865437 [Mycena epipterygia]|nr:hypothetical protein C8R44DRAFT_865437 [Mycena epipterygia]